MAIETFKGPDQLLDAVEASLSRDFSAVVLSNAAVHLKALNKQFRKNEYSPVRVLREALPLLDAEERVRRWASNVGLTYRGIGMGIERSGGIQPHVDAPAITPFALSLSIKGDAIYRTQFLPAEGYNTRNMKFNDECSVDEFTQHQGDLVIIPSGVMHEVIANSRRTARIFTTESY